MGEVSRPEQHLFAHGTVYHGCKQQPHWTGEITLPAQNLFKEPISIQDRRGLCIWVASCLNLQGMANRKRGWVGTIGDSARRTRIMRSRKTLSPSHGASTTADAEHRTWKLGLHFWRTGWLQASSYRPPSEWYVSFAPRIVR